MLKIHINKFISLSKYKFTVSVTNYCDVCGGVLLDNGFCFYCSEFGDE